MMVENIRASFSVPFRSSNSSLQASLTVEAAIIVPFFVFVIIAVMQYGTVFETAVKFGTSLAESGKMIAEAAYLTECTENTGSAADAIGNIFSIGYAKNKMISDADDTSAVKGISFLQSSILSNEREVELIVTYQMKAPISGILLPGRKFVQRASVRAWTGRIPSGDGEETGEEKDTNDQVYVTATGNVYHDDPECSYLKPSIKEVTKEETEHLRNNSGGKYYVCEKCGEGNGTTVFITKDGTKYHSSSTCSGLKRTITQVNKGECTLKGCSKCSSTEE